ncbi:MAG: transposase [Leptospiraceae bacterium]|nr:transposase [Leptospiraceae bacterium]
MRQIFHTLTMVFGKKINNKRFPMNKQNKSQSSDQSKKMSMNDFRKYAVTEIERFVRKSAVKMITGIIEEEVTLLCGSSFQHKKGGLAHRAGSDKGSIILNGKKVPIGKPRVRQHNKEIQSESYQKMKDKTALFNHVFKLMISGLITCSYDDVVRELEEEFGISKSSISLGTSLRNPDRI